MSEIRPEEYTDASLHPDTAGWVAEIVRWTKPERVLEFGLGGGIGTRTILNSSTSVVVSAEHQQQWIDHARTWNDYGNRLLIVNYDAVPRNAQYDTVLIDGKDRYQCLVDCWELLTEDCLIILDDANRKTEQDIMRRWEEKFGITFRTVKIGRGIAVGYKKVVQNKVALLSNTKMLGGGERSVLKLIEMLERQGVTVEKYSLSPGVSCPGMEGWRDWRTCNQARQIWVMNDKMYRLQKEELSDFITVAQYATDMRIILNFVIGGLNRKTWLRWLNVKKVLFLNESKRVAWEQTCDALNKDIPTAVLPPPVDIERFLDSAATTERINIGTHGGRRTDDEGALYRGLLELPGAQFHFLPAPRNIVELSKADGHADRFHFHPKTNDVAEIIKFLSGLDIYLYHLSAGVHTQGPRTVIEAMAMGLPVVTDNCPHCGMRDRIVHGKTGFLCNDLEEMIHTVRVLASNAGLRAEIGGNAREAAKTMQPENWLKELL